MQQHKKTILTPLGKLVVMATWRARVVVVGGTKASDGGGLLGDGGDVVNQC
jgi:hypothetical protein